MSVQLKTNKQMHKSCKAITKRKKGRIMNIYLAGDSIVQNYTAEGGIQALDIMLTDLEKGLK